jgi:iron complex outermembrane recepter protein
LEERHMLKLRQKSLSEAIGWAIAAGTLVSASASAQTAPSSADDPAKLETITVTTQRRAEDAQKISVSVTAISAEKLSDRGINDISQMEAMAPGFTMGRSGTDARPAMRGVRTENVAVNADTTIGFFVDGVYRSRAQQAMSSFVDLERVEIQRGPQGTLYGRNTFGGNIAISTGSPYLKAQEFSGSLQFGSFNKVRAEGMINVPASSGFGVRAVLMADKADGFVKNDFNKAADLFDNDILMGRAAFKFKPDNKFEATLRLESAEQRGNGGSAFGYKQVGTYYDLASCQQLFNTTKVVLNVRAGNRDGVADCTRTVGAGAGTGANAVGTTLDQGVPLYAAGNGYRVDTDYQSFLRSSDKNASLDMSYNFGPFSLKSITGFADFGAKRSADGDFSASTIAIDYQDTAAKTLSQELQILSEGSGPLTYVGGLYYFQDKLRGTFINQQLARTIRSSAVAAPISAAQNGAGFFDEQRPETTSTAAYAQLGFKVTPEFTLTAGARYTEDKKSFRFANANSVLPTALSTGGAIIGIQQPDGRLIDLNTPSPNISAFGTAGVNNCAATAISGLNGGAILQGSGFNCGGPGNAILYGGTYNDTTFSKTTFRVAGDYALNRSQLLYASYSTGFRSGGFNSGQALDAVRTFKPEGVKAIEIGSKNRFLRDTLQLNIAAFQNDYTDLQEQRQVPVGSTTISTIFNAAGARAKGIELEATWRASKQTTLSGNLALLDAKYTSFPDVALPFGTSILVADPAQTTATVVNGVTIAPAGQRRVFARGYNCGLVSGTGGAGQPGAAYGCDLTGNRLPYAQKMQASVSFSHEIPMGNLGVITPLVVATYSSGYYGQPTNAEIEKQGAYTKLDLKLNWQITDRFQAQAFIDNITDESTINRFVWGGGGALQVSYAPPRMFGLKVAYRM